MKRLGKFINLVLITIIVSQCGYDDNADIVNDPVESICLTGRNNLLFTCFRTGVFDLRATLTMNSAFPNTEIIEIPPYSYPAPPNPSSNLNSLISIGGDNKLESILRTEICCEINQILDRFPSVPSFQWETTSSTLTAMAIFNSPTIISSNGARIENIDNVVWTWNSGMGGEVQSSGKTIVDFFSGKDVLNGEILDTTTALRENQVYSWLVWGWNNEGTMITLSSRVLPFVVERLPSIAFTEAEQLSSGGGVWRLVSALNPNSNSDLRNEFPIQGFVVNIECDEVAKTETTYFSIFPENLEVSIDTLENQITMGAIDFFNISFPCEERLVAKANYNNEILNVLYELE